MVFPCLSAFTRFTAGSYLVFADVMVTNHQTGTLRVVTSLTLKELLVFFLELIIASCFVVELFLSKPVFVDVLKGFIPTIDSDSLYTATGIIGVSSI